MKTLSLFLAVALLLTLPASRLNSQSQQPVTPSALLLQMKKNNDALLERQAATLKTLTELEAQATQIRIYTKRG